MEIDLQYLASKNAAAVFGITFILAGLLSFVPNPLVSGDGIVAVNFVQNLVLAIVILATGFALSARQLTENSGA